MAHNTGDGIWFYAGGGTNTSTVTNCTVTDNTMAGISSSYGAHPVVHNTIVWGNATPVDGSGASITYCDVEGGWPGAGNIDADPLLTGDYHIGDG